MTQLRLRVEGQSFRDPQNREVTLRGINVAGDAKYPKVLNLGSHDPEDFFNADNVSFIGRPFSLEHADAHFQRLRKWGYNAIRYIFTWEAIEHAGPGVYDEEWVDFTIQILGIAKKYQFYIFMDPHQDVWSRLSGGSGAPAWTFYAAGLNPRCFQNTEAALSHHTSENPADFPKMLWCTNYTRLACQTMFTLFWAGRDFAPKAVIDGMNIQDFLQGHFIAACKYLAQKIHDAGGLEHDVVIGWESLNEPHKGLVGIQDISKVPQEQHLQLGTSPTAFQGMLLGVGRGCEVMTWRFGRFGPRRTGKKLINPSKSVWLQSECSQYGWKRDPGWKLGECLWAQHGVWDPTNNDLLQKDYFSKSPGSNEGLDYEKFTNTYFLAHYRAYRDAIRSVCAGTIMFCQPPVMEVPPSIKGTPDDDPNMVHAVHFYDGLTLLRKHWSRFLNIDVIGVLRGRHSLPVLAVKFGETSIRNGLRNQLTFIRDESLRNVGNHPLIFTEIGIPYDLDNKHAYKTGDYRSQVKAMDANHFALEGSSANGFTLWAYMTENDHAYGDQWNGEDFSIFSLDDLELPENITSRSTSSRYLTLSEDHDTEQSTKVDPHVQDLLTLGYTSSDCDQSEDVSTRRRGYRAAEAYLRPSPIRVRGQLHSYDFDLKKCTFTMAMTAKATVPHSPSEIYLPHFHFEVGNIAVTVSEGEWEIVEQEFNTVRIQCLLWWHDEGKVNIKIKGKHPKPRKLGIRH
ncbi:hypothetical protein N7508_002827 [Penicillium antarcticum]|uniref:uncharacterized protein n=1 Tax=Penicillium antarcticum TaxID=416450 RepID=UPI002399F50E|nr:uncharacterized protein N7508_002827 [Penicillium antarcticum]KAJ5311997.1 hypothetical protein N7508_002827 [Penicillium antarcticum]